MEASFPPLRFKPIPVPRVWGGDRIASRFGRTFEEGKIGETWELSDRAGAESVVDGGPFDGRTLRDLARERPDVLYGDDRARFEGGRFPILAKLLDCQDLLSVQVHPDAPTARALGGEPKAEAWVVLEAPPGSELYCGLADGVDAGALRRALAGGDVRACLRRLDVKAGDCVFVPAGTVHAMGKGLLLAEIQQNSDTTYRLHDWNRKGLDGRPRALHIEEAFKSLRQDPAAGLRAGRTIRSADGIHRTIWIEEGPFTLQRMTFDALKRWRLDPGCLCVGVLEGKGRLGPEIYSPGEWWLLGAECSARTLVAETTTTLLLATPR